MFNVSPVCHQSSHIVDRDHYLSILQLNVCGAAPDCGRINEKPAAVCDGSEPLASVSSDLKLSASGQLTLTYTGKRDAAGGIPIYSVVAL